MYLETHMTFSKAVLIDSQVIRTQEVGAVGCQTTFDILRPKKAELSEPQEWTETGTSATTFHLLHRYVRANKVFLHKEANQYIYSITPINQHVETVFPGEYLHTQTAH